MPGLVLLQSLVWSVDRNREFAQPFGGDSDPLVDPDDGLCFDLHLELFLCHQVSLWTFSL